MILTIKLSIRISAAPGRVFQAVVQPRELERWLVPKAIPESHSADTLIFQWPHHSFPVTTLSKSQDSAVTWSWYNEQGVGDTVTWTLEPDNGGTIIRIEHSGFSDAPEHLEMYCNHIEGWTAYLCNLRCYIEWNQDLRANQHKGSIAM